MLWPAMIEMLCLTAELGLNDGVGDSQVCLAVMMIVVSCTLALVGA